MAEPVARLIGELLRALQNQFYPDRPHEFFRDRTALMKSIARYGQACLNRGWHFDARAIERDLFSLLNEIKRTGADIQYLPAYLEAAVDRHVRTRAEELREAALRPVPRTLRTVEKLERVEAIREPSGTEILAAVYRDLKHKTGRRVGAKSVGQMKLL